MAKEKVKKKTGLFIWFIIIIILIAILGIVLGVSHYRNKGELQLSNANDTLCDIATETGLVDKSEGSFYITLYVTAGFILIAGIAVFVYVHKKADE